ACRRRCNEIDEFLRKLWRRRTRADACAEYDDARLTIFAWKFDELDAGYRQDFLLHLHRYLGFTQCNVLRIEDARGQTRFREDILLDAEVVENACEENSADSASRRVRERHTFRRKQESLEIGRRLRIRPRAAAPHRKTEWRSHEVPRTFGRDDPASCKLRHRGLGQDHNIEGTTLLDFGAKDASFTQADRHLVARTGLEC